MHATPSPTNFHFADRLHADILSEYLLCIIHADLINELTNNPHCPLTSSICIVHAE